MRLTFGELVFDTNQSYLNLPYVKTSTNSRLAITSSLLSTASSINSSSIPRAEVLSLLVLQTVTAAKYKRAMRKRSIKDMNNILIIVQNCEFVLRSVRKNIAVSLESL